MSRTTVLAAALAVAIPLGLAGEAHARGDETRLRASLSGGAGDVSGHADFRDRGGVRKFSAEIEGFTPGDLYDVTVAGVVVGTVTIDAFGVGELELDDNFEPGSDDPATIFPTNFPVVAAGVLVEVGPLSGSFQGGDRGRTRDRRTVGTRDLFRAPLLGDPGAGDVSGHADFRNESGFRRFSVEAEGLVPGDVHDVMVAGVVVGTVTVDALGIGQLELDDRLEPGDTELPFPASFPAINGGELVRVGPVSGTLQRN